VGGFQVFGGWGGAPLDKGFHRTNTCWKREGGGPGGNEKGDVGVAASGNGPKKENNRKTVF